MTDTADATVPANPPAGTASAPNTGAMQPVPQGGLEVISIAKSYDKRAVLSDISLSVGKGEVLGLLGPTAPARPPVSTRSWASSARIPAAS